MDLWSINIILDLDLVRPAGKCAHIRKRQNHLVDNLTGLNRLKTNFEAKIKLNVRLNQDGPPAWNIEPA